MSSTAMTITETADWLKERDGFLIITHRRPDGDTVGCAGALAQGLRDFGKTAYVLFNPEVTPRYAGFIEDYWAPDGFSSEFVIAIDTASHDLFPKNGEKYIGAVSLAIDHHPSYTKFAQHDCIDKSCASCGEIVFEILTKLSVTISAKIAGSLYAALTTDTGCFAFSNTTANTLRVASLLVEYGAPLQELNKRLFRTKTRSRAKIEGMINSGIEFYFGGAVAIATITRSMADEAAAVEDDFDDVASIPGSIEGVHTGITIRELTSTRDCKVSVRTSPLVNADAICARFGGGGHPMAAGFSLEASVSEIKEMLLAELGAFLPDL